MRKILATAALGLVLTVAGAATPDEASPEARAYLGFSFGGERAAPRDFHYGLRLDHDSRYTDGRIAPLVQFDFTRRGFNAARINGVSVVRQEFRLRQNEQPEGAPAEEAPVEEVPAEEPAAETADAAAEGGEAAASGEPGFFAKTWAGIKGLFGGGEEGAADDVAEEASAGEAADGMFTSYGVVDWGLLVVGAVGVGLAAGEVSNGEESPNPTGGADGGGDGGADGGGDGGDGGDGGVDICPIPDTCIPYAPASRYGHDRVDPEYQEWLDGGTGQMGDLGG
ncbi:MAG: hypothetical protein ACRES8_07690 [Nevskiaceae bacterium]